MNISGVGCARMVPTELHIAELDLATLLVALVRAVAENKIDFSSTAFVLAVRAYLDNRC